MPIPIIFGNQSSIHATCKGTITLSLSNPAHVLQLEGVLFAPGNGCNLLSVGSLTGLNSYNLIKSGTTLAPCQCIGGMHRLHCRIVDKRTFPLVGTTSANSTYTLNSALNPTAAVSTPANYASAIPLPLRIWHRHLGYFNKLPIKRLVSRLVF